MRLLQLAGTLLLAAIPAVGSGCDGGTGPGSISISLSQTGAVIVQGGSLPVTATLTRAGGFSGPVNVTITGAPAGVTAAVSNVQTAGNVTTATVTLAVAAATAPGLYPLVVRGSGSGVEATLAFALTVATAPGITVTLVPASGAIQQGGSLAVTGTLTRAGGFTGLVTLTVTGTPTGVTALISNAQTAGPVTTATVIILVGNLVAPAVYPIVVRGTGTGVSEATATFTLTVTAGAVGRWGQ